MFLYHIKQPPIRRGTQNPVQSSDNLQHFPFSVALVIYVDYYAEIRPYNYFLYHEGTLSFVKSLSTSVEIII